MNNPASDASQAERATSGDLPSLRAMLIRANTASAQYDGHPTWPFITTALEHLERDISDGEVYCLYQHAGLPYASVSIARGDKKGLWPIESTKQPALYFSKLMKDPLVNAHGVIYTLLAQVIALAKTHGVDSIRCDAVANNTKLIAFYSQIGFISKGTAPYPYPGDTRQAELLEINRDQLERVIAHGGISKQS